MVQLQKCDNILPLRQAEMLPLLLPKSPFLLIIPLEQHLQKLLPPDYQMLLLLFLKIHIVRDQPFDGLINKGKLVLAHPRFAGPDNGGEPVNAVQDRFNGLIASPGHIQRGADSKYDGQYT
ncbi:hypothetical protein D3C81_1542420 [compost metagenome]